MKTFMVLTYGFEPPTKEVQQAWGDWFTSVTTSLADPGSPFVCGVELTLTTRTDLTLGSPSPLTGYCILTADSLVAAEALVADMPLIESVRIYETRTG